MKKLMLAFVAIATAVVAQAASFDWKTSTTGKLYAADGATLFDGTAYIFDSAAVTQAAVLEAFASNTLDLSKALDDKSVSAGKISATSGEAFSWGTAGAVLNSFVVAVSGDNIFISDTVPATAPAISYETVTFSLKNQSQAGIQTGDFSQGGWYTAAVPEPTSGLLMLLGMAGLALRRRRA